MSTQEKRLEVLTETRKPLAERLSSIGIAVPDQRLVAHMMEAVRLGLPPQSSEWRVRWAWIRRNLTRDRVRWQLYDYKRYASTENLYGVQDYRPIPLAVQDIAGRISRYDPSIKLKVHALFVDPWLSADDGLSSVFVTGWMGDDVLI